MSTERRLGQQVLVFAAAAVVTALVVAASVVVGVRVTLSSLQNAQDGAGFGPSAGGGGSTSTNELVPSSGSGDPGAPITLRDVATSALPHQTVRLSGQAPAYGFEQTLQVQLRGTRGWITFPLPAVTDWMGHFTAYVELGRLGRNQLRVVDPSTGSVSNVVTVIVSQSAAEPSG